MGRRQRTSSVKKEPKAGTLAGNTVNEVSVTVIASGLDLPPVLFDKLGEWLISNSTQGLFGYERGGEEGNGHAQGVIR